MNDPGLDQPIQDTATLVTHTLKERIPANSARGSNNQSPGAREAFRQELEVDEEEEEVGYFQPKRWWFTSTAFPLIAGTFGPLANLLSVCALVQAWRVTIPDGGNESQGTPIKDPAWLLTINSLSLALALVANLLLLFNFAHRIRYSVAQPLTITLWYLSSILLIVPLCLTNKLIIYPTSEHAFSQSYYYAIISASLYFIISSLLLFNTLGAYMFKAYPPSFNSLTIPQRTLMLQTISYVLYLALGAGVFSRIEDWEYVNGVYWADYTLLTIGLGTDFPLQTTAGRALLIPYAVGGITMLGLVIGSVRGLVLERGKTKVIRRTLEREREKCIDRMDSPSEEWKKKEFEAMREIEGRAETKRKWWSLGLSFFAFLVVWLGGALVFFFSEKPQAWTYFQSLYFAYTSLLTIGYGDFFPQSNSGKPFFVIWSLIAVPTVTILISNMGNTVVGWLKRGTLWLGQRTILPERDDDGNLEKSGPRGVQEAARREEARDSDATADGGDGGARGLGRDVEELGGAVEKAEAEMGKGSSLEARLAREIRRVAKDVGRKPPRKYTWEEWVGWLELLGERDERGTKAAGKETDASEDGTSRDVEWTWLGDDGPLFSQAGETEWVLGRLCKRLEEVFENDVKEARTGPHQPL